MTGENFKMAMAGLAGAFNRVLEPAALRGYEIGLADLTDEQMGRAASAALRTCRFMPTPAELRDLAGAGSKADALLAWDAVRAALRRHSYTQGLDFGPLVNAVVRNMGGIRRLDDMPTAELDVWGKKEFERVYALLATQAPERLNGAPLPGAFGGEPVRVAIAGVAPARALPAVTTGVQPIVRQLAEAASGGRR